MKNSSETIENRTRDLPVSSAVPQPTAPPRSPSAPVDTYIYWDGVHLSHTFDTSCVTVPKESTGMEFICLTLSTHHVLQCLKSLLGWSSFVSHFRHIMCYSA